MTPSSDRLYDLLPVIYRIRDAQKGEPLRALLRVIGEQVDVVEEDIRQLYENWFIETCQDWVVPYIGDLIGYEQVGVSGNLAVDTPEGQERMRVLIPRREVANTVRYRRRKGTLALLEDLARDVAGWPARAVEFYTLLGWTQPVFAPRPDRGGLADIRNGDAMDKVGGPFDTTAHTVDTRQIRSRYDPAGRFNIPNVGIYIWRLKSYSVTKTQAYCVEKQGKNCFTFSALGNDTPLFTRPEDEPSADHIAQEMNVPDPIRRRVTASPDRYGEGKSLAIWAQNWPKKGTKQPVPGTNIVPADLSGWSYVPKKGSVAVDPVLGRIVFPSRHPPDRVMVSYQYGFSADIGGGEYNRPVQQPGMVRLFQVGKGHLATLNEALVQWYREMQENPADAVIQIEDSWVYVERIGIPMEGGIEESRAIPLVSGYSLQIRAANGKRPILRILDYTTEGPDALTVHVSEGSRFTLDGLTIEGRGVHIEGPASFAEDTGLESNSAGPEQATSSAQSGEPPCFDQEGAGGEDKPPSFIRISHCTLVPGWTIRGGDCEPAWPAEPSLELIDLPARVEIDHSILGSIQVSSNEVHTDPIPMEIRDSIIDATGTDCDSPECIAIGNPDVGMAFANLTIRRSTLIGKALVHSVELAENSIFHGTLRVARRQIGCLRFCSVKPKSRTPRRYHCQPDLVEKPIREVLQKENGLTNEERDRLERLLSMERLRVKPQFTSTRYGTPGYCQLARTCANEIRSGADDGSEMGVFHDLYQPQREELLRTRLDEYVPAGTEAGIIYVN
jgi:hypothetical protein